MRTEAACTGVNVLLGERDGEALACIGESDNVPERTYKDAAARFDRVTANMQAGVGSPWGVESPWMLSSVDRRA